MMGYQTMNQSKDKTKVVILTGHYRIIGKINLVTGARLTDYIVDAKSFIALTEAEVTDREGRRIFNAPFLNIQRDRIEVIVPAEIATTGYKTAV